MPAFQRSSRLGRSMATASSGNMEHVVPYPAARLGLGEQKVIRACESAYVPQDPSEWRTRKRIRKTVLSEPTTSASGVPVLLKTTRMDVRLIASINRDLRESVQRREFRSDLYNRLLSGRARCRHSSAALSHVTGRRSSRRRSARARGGGRTEHGRSSCCPTRQPYRAGRHHRY